MFLMLINNLKSGRKVLAYDVETTGNLIYGDVKRWGFYPSRPFAFSFMDEEGNSAYFRLEVDPFTRQVLPQKKVSIEVNALLQDKSIRKVGHNLNYDIKMSKASDLVFQGPVDDTMIMAHVVTGGNELAYGLKPLGVKYLQVTDDDEKALSRATQRARAQGRKLGWKIAQAPLFGKEPHKADYWMASAELLKEYALKDVERTILLWLLWKDEIFSSPDLRRVYEREMHVFHVVPKMEDRGVRYFPEESKALRKFYIDYRNKQLALAGVNGGKGLNFRSPKQMVNKFVKELGFSSKRRTKTGQPKIDADFLAATAENEGSQLAKAILEYRAADHMLSGFLDPYDRYCVQENHDWVVHPNYRQIGPITGRWACGEPNLMQVANKDAGRRRTEINLRPREVFGPREGHVWYLPDYSQIEVWVFAFLAQEKVMMDALLSGRDFHGSIAERIWGKEPDWEVNKKKYRNRGKLLMFTKIYGGGAGKVAQLLGTTEAEAYKFINQYDNELPGVRTFMSRNVAKATREGFIFNPFGRMYYIDPNFAYRATNYLVQGSAADIMKEAMINVDRLFDRWKGCFQLLTLHDELVQEIPLKYHSLRLMREIIKCMQGDFHKYIGCPVPLPVSMKIARKRWSETEEVKL